MATIAKITFIVETRSKIAKVAEIATKSATKKAILKEVKMYQLTS